MSQCLDQLNKAQWLSKPSDESVFSKLGIRYGFMSKEGDAYAGHSVKQVHGIAILPIEDGKTDTRANGRAVADGLYTQEAGTTIGIKTADCLPVLLATEKKTSVMALHAGWRGLGQGIIGLGVKKLQELSPGESIYAYLGPSISSPNYEVGPEVVTAMSGLELGLSAEQLAFCLTKGKADRWHLDLACAGTFTLINHGLLPENISVLRSCTFAQEKLWHSFRRDSVFAGRIWTWIARD